MGNTTAATTGVKQEWVRARIEGRREEGREGDKVELGVWQEIDRWEGSKQEGRRQGGKTRREEREGQRLEEKGWREGGRKTGGKTEAVSVGDQQRLLKEL